MEEIISYFYEVFIPKIIDVRINFYKDEHHCVGDLALATKNETDKLGQKVLECFISEMDTLIKELPDRKQEWYVERATDKKCLTTTLGEIVFTKTLYTSKTEVTDDGKELQCYLLDIFLELDENQFQKNEYTSAWLEQSWCKATNILSSWKTVKKKTTPEGVALKRSATHKPNLSFA